MTEASPPTPSERGRALAALGLVGLVLFLHRDAVFGGGVYFKRDVHLIWHPQVEAFVRAVAQGAWPVWDPNPAFGQPLLADASAQVLYPLTWLNLILRPWIYYTIFVVAHSLLAGFGMWALARHWGASERGSFVAAATWVLGGPMVSLVDLWHHFAGAAWMPLVFLAGDRAITRKRTGDVLLFALALSGQILAGSADMCAMTGLAFLAHVAVFHLRWRAPFAPGNRVLALGLAAFLLALGVTAGLWMTALDVASRSMRWSLGAETRTYWSVHPLGLLELLLPGIWTGLPLQPRLRELLFESREPFLASLYLGLPTVGLVVGGLALAPARRKTFLLVVCAVAILFSLGRHQSFYDAMLVVLPPLRILRYPVKALVLAGFAWSMLAGLGFDGWSSSSSGVGRRWLAVVAGLAVLTLVAAGAGLSALWAPDFWTSRAVQSAAGLPPTAALQPLARRLGVAAGLGLLTLALAVIRGRRAPAASILAASLGLIATLDLAAFHRHPNPTAPKELYTHRPELVDRLRREGATRVYVYDYTFQDASTRHLHRAGLALGATPARWDAQSAFALAMQMALAPATAGRWSIPTAYDVDYRGLYPPSLAQVTALLRLVEGRPQHQRLLRIAAVSHVVALHEEGFEELLPVTTIPGLYVEPIRLFAVPGIVPRTSVVGAARSVEVAQALEAVLDPDFEPLHEVILSGAGIAPRGERAGSPPGRPIGESRILEERADRVLIEADMQSPGYAVLSDTFDPGWQARVDGQPAVPLQANLLFRAVELPPGRHRVEWIYRPRALIVGLAVSTLTLLLVLVLGLLQGRPPRR